MTLSLADSLVEVVRNEGLRIDAILPHCKWYLFGSVTTAKRPVADIDVLVVCENNEECTKVREAMSSVCAERPIHLLLMTQSEEKEVNFIRSQRAIELRLARRAD
jgi:hypothetical protein